ncbi:MAG TPA: VWA domain-containing protein, partial [Pirellulales bacterium]|nr:VWA domain-containing protein [Pirellulales bacterium]
MLLALPITVDSPALLGLLALLPLVWYLGFRSLAGLGRWRRAAVLLLRSAALVLLVLAAAEMQWVRRSQRLTVIYLVDQSLSVPAGQRNALIDCVNEAIRHQRQGSDRVGVIVFGREAVIEYPPLAENIQVPHTIESRLDPGHTNLAGAIKLAQAAFPEDSARRIVILSDGNENLGSAQQQADLALASGIGIDVYPIRRPAGAEVAVEKLVLPSDIRRGQPFEMRIALSANLPAPAGNSPPGNSPAGKAKSPGALPGPARPGTVGGRLIVSQRADDQRVVLSDQHIDLPPGKRVFTLRQQIDQPNFYSYEARFVPDEAADDTFTQNNRATAFTHVRGKGQVLLIEDDEHRGQHDLLVEDLRQDNAEVTVWASKQLFAGISELQRFDTVILAGVARENFSDEQIAMLARNTQDLGCGLIMLGSPNSFGAGGWANTEIEKAMPIDFSIKNVKVMPTGALALVLDHSGSMSGEKMEMSKDAAIAAVKVLGPGDFIGVVAFDSDAHWVVPMQKVGKADRIVSAIRRLAIGGGTNMQPGMAEGYRAIQAVSAAVKHVIVLTDGQTEGGQYEAMAASMLRQGVTTTCVALGQDSAVPLLTAVARSGGGKFYLVNDPRAIPRIFMKEAMRVARPLVYEDERGFVPKLKYTHEITSGISGKLPPLTGYVMSTIKRSPLVEVGIVAPVPEIEENATILASWNFGLGKAVALTTDAGERWAKAWTNWGGYQKLFSQMVRWSMRPTGDEDQFIVSTDAADGKVNVFVTALDKNNEFLNFLQL